MKTSKELNKLMKSNIISFYVPLEGFNKDKIKFFCGIDRMHPLFSSTKNDFFIDGGGTCQREFVNLSDKNGIAFFKKSVFIQLDDDQLSEVQMKKSFFENPTKYNLFSDICDSILLNMNLNKLYKVLKNYDLNLN